ncbi:MAG: hypothetical protein HKN12_04980, partial [Gemmatimonadetes bacterium]|nr:hypothetical protein [Gemmatimonadota bacterium]
LLTGAGGDARSPAFTPDGTSVSFLASRGASGSERVWVLPLDGGEAAPWTDESVDAETYVWGPAGDLFYSTRAGGFSEIRQVRAFDSNGDGNGNETVRFRTGSTIRDFSVSSDGARIAVSVEENGRRGVWLAGAPGDEPGAVPDARAVDAGAGGFAARIYEPENAVLFGVRKDGAPDEVRLVPLDDAGADADAPRVIAEFPAGTLREIRTAASSTRLYVVVGDEFRTRLARIIVANGRVEYVTPEEGHVRNVFVKEDGERAAFVWETPRQAPEIATWVFPDTYVEVRTQRNEPLTRAAAEQNLSLHWTQASRALREEPASPLGPRAELFAAIGRDAPAGGFLVVNLNLPSGDPGRVLQLSGEGADVALVMPDGRRRHPVGVPVAWSGREHLLRGTQTARLDGGRIRLAFEGEALSSPAWLHALDYPPVEIHWANPGPTEDGDS